MKLDFDVIIVGAGTMGMAAGYYLAKRSKKVLLIDQFDLLMKWGVITARPVLFVTH